MKIKFLFLFFCLYNFSFSKDLMVKAVYYNAKNTPFLIEEKYFEKHDSSTIYIIHDQSNSVVIRRTEIKHNDTLIVKEEYCYIVREKSKIELFAECDMFGYGQYNNSDSVNITFSKQDYSTGVPNYILVGDTTLGGEEAKNNSMSFIDKIKNQRVAMILKNEIIINIDSLRTQETITSYFVNKNLLKILVFDENNILYAESNCKYSINEMIYHLYHLENRTNTLTQTATFSWNNDTTEIKWKESKYNTTAKYVIDKSTLKIYNDNKLFRTIRFQENTDLFHNLINDKIVYNDDLYNSNLRVSDREKELKIIYENGDTKNINYQYNKQNRLIEQKEFFNNVLSRTVKYSY